MKSALKTLLRRLIALVLMIGPFAVPAEAETAQDRLWAAINAQDATSLRVAVEQGADPNLPNSEGRVPLYRVLVLQNQLLTDTLLGLGANANANDHRGDPLIITAMSVGSAPATMALINAGANPNARDTTGKSVLSYAVYLKQPEIIAALIAKGADVNAPSEAGDGGNPAPPIFMAIKAGDLALVQQLIAAGANVDALDGKGSTPLHRAVLARPAEYTALARHHAAARRRQRQRDAAQRRRAAAQPHLRRRQPGAGSAGAARHAAGPARRRREPAGRVRRRNAARHRAHQEQPGRGAAADLDGRGLPDGVLGA